MKSRVEIQAEGTIAHNDKIILEGQDISKYITGWEVTAMHGEIRKVTLHIISTEHLLKMDAEAEVIPTMELGGKTYRLVEEEDELPVMVHMNDD